METALEQLKYLPETRAQIETFVQNAKTEILSGTVEAKDLLYRKAMIERTFEQLFSDKEVKDYLCGEIELYGKEGVKYEDATIQVRHRKSYDYSRCGYTELDKERLLAEGLKKNITAKEKFLQNLSGEFTNSEGDKLTPPTFTESTYINVAIK